jgi:hypothetical protein
MEPSSKQLRAKLENYRTGPMEQFRRGIPVSEILKGVVQSCPEIHTKFHMLQWIRETFCLSLGQASPIGGWEPDGTGELSDTQLDKLLGPEIEKNRQLWDSPRGGAA